MTESPPKSLSRPLGIVRPGQLGPKNAALMTIRTTLRALLLVAVSIAIPAGCGPTDPPGTLVRGRIVENGAPIPAPRADVGVGIVEIELHPVGDPPGRGVEATAATGEGIFELVGPGSGIAAGEYEVVLMKREVNADYFEGKFAKGASPIRVTVPADKAEHDLGDIDVAEY